MADKKISYTDAMAEIEKILAELKGDNIDVDTLTEKVARASSLIELCKNRLRTTAEEVKKHFEE